MVRIGIAGIGFMGMIHYLGAQKLRGAEVTALSSRDRAKLAGDWTGIRGNFGPPGAHMDLSHLKRYEAYDDLLRDPTGRRGPGLYDRVKREPPLLEDANRNFDLVATREHPKNRGDDFLLA
jgi:predicted dehydrogenase